MEEERQQRQHRECRASGEGKMHVGVPAVLC